MWQPWRGRNYNNRLLLLGESCYAWHNEGQLIHPEPNHPVNIVEAAIEEPPGYGRFMRCLTRSLCGVEHPTEAQAQEAWDTVAFTNYVPLSVGVGPSMRPSAAAWTQAYNEWDDLINIIQPKKVIVLGLTMWSKMPDTQIQIEDSIQGYNLNNGDVSMCYAIRHPSYGPGWREYANFITHVEQQ
ncbi:hypothetical protein MKK64_12025 [Methylobacterium sp. E-025]|uniref:hypothetical protein n=1 Tax=Methylobacterium sp. E-025 TaxID=2836561 RepID=UPI001FBBDD2C|nr:hypothetical protein [Methylobacterium sp. E-025]MCJ2111923.1 hypothetical protein [Methylobacterium sp. E-025]